MSQLMRGHVELDGVRLYRCTGFDDNGGRPKTKVIPVGAIKATDTNIAPQQVNGSITITGTEEDGFEFDYVALCNGTSTHTFCRHFSTAWRKLITDVEFSTYSDPIPTGDGELSVTVNWVGTEELWE